MVADGDVPRKVVEGVGFWFEIVEEVADGEFARRVRYCRVDEE